MRVLHLLKTSVGATWALRQIDVLVKRGVEVHVALPSGGPMVGRYTSRGATEHLLQTALPVRRPWEAPSVLRGLARLVDEVKPDIIHSHFVATTLSMRLAPYRRRSTPRIFQVPGPLHLEHWPFRKAEVLVWPGLRTIGSPPASGPGAPICRRASRQTASCSPTTAPTTSSS